MPDIILAYPPVTLTGRYGEIATGHEVPPQPLLYLASVLREKGFSVEIIDANAYRWSSKKVVDYIIEKAPLCAGITAPTMLISTAGLISEKIKEANPEIITLVGGPHISAMPIETMKHYPHIDIGVVGEGEGTIVELIAKLKKLNKRLDLKEIKGIAFRSNNEVKLTEKRPYIDDLDTLPYPAWDLLPDILKHYQQSVARVDKLPAISIITSRGCPYQCTFCARNVFGNKIRAHSAAYMINLIKFLISKYKVKSLCIEDENFVIFKKRLIELCQMMIDEKLGITWSCASSINEINPDILKLMKKAGCWQISFGIESGSQDILDSIKKGTKLERIEYALKITKEAGIMTKGYFIIGHLRETEETIKKTINFAKRIALDDFQMSHLVPFPGTEIYAQAGKFGEFNNDWSQMNIWTPLFIPRGFKKADLEYWSKKAFREFYFRPRPIFNFMKRASRPAYIKKYFSDGFKIFKFLLRKN